MMRRAAILAIAIVAGPAFAGPATNHFDLPSTAHTSPLPAIVFQDAAQTMRPRPPRCGRDARTIVVDWENNRGGQVDTHRARVDAALSCGDSVRVEDVCISACTLWLMMPPARICAKAAEMRFQFHQVSDTRTGRRMDDATRRLFASYPARVREAITLRGGLHRDYINISAAELGLAICQ